MKDGFLKVASVTPSIRVADPVYNAGQICERIAEAAAGGAKIIVCPELCLTGYTCNDLFLQDSLLAAAKEQLSVVIRGTAGSDALVFVGLPLVRNQKLYSVAAVLQDGRLLGIVPKTFLPAYGEFYETRHFTPGNKKPVPYIWEGQEVPFGTNLLFRAEGMEDLIVGCEICEDLWTPDAPGRHHALAGANVIVNLSASDETIGKADYRRMLVQSASASLLCGYIYASAGEGESTQDLVFGGHDMIAENGAMLAEAERFTPGILFADLDIKRLVHERRRMNTYPSAETDDYLVVPFSLKQTETVLARSFDPAPFVPADEAERERRCEEILSIQAGGLAKRLSHTNAQTAVVGLSGGLDSTLAFLVTARAFDALGKNHADIIAVTMPCFGTTDRTYQNACSLARALGATLREIPIGAAVEQHFSDIGQDSEQHDVTYENSQARERTQVLMDVANKTGGLVVGTGDMSELALGWATYNGDHMSMYGVNAGVPKTLVRHLVRYAADICGDQGLRTVLLDILDTPVSPELLPPVDGVISQKTEDLVGPYELHDFFLYHMLRFGSEPAKIYRMACLAFAGRYDGKEILHWLREFYRRFFAQQFKRSCLPDGPKVGSVALSPRGDLRMPSDASAALWLRQVEEL